MLKLQSYALTGLKISLSWVDFSTSCRKSTLSISNPRTRSRLSSCSPWHAYSSQLPMRLTHKSKSVKRCALLANQAASMMKILWRRRRQKTNQLETKYRNYSAANWAWRFCSPRTMHAFKPKFCHLLTPFCSRANSVSRTRLSLRTLSISWSAHCSTSLNFSTISVISIKMEVPLKI